MIEEKFKFLFRADGKVNTAWIREDRLKIKHPQIYEEVMKMFPLYTKIGDKLRAIQNGDYFRCYNCGNIIFPPANTKLERVYCSSKCGNSSEYKKEITRQATQTAEVKAKRKVTILKKYGVENMFSSKEIQAKLRATFKEKYGTENISSLPKVKKKARETFNKHKEEIKHNAILRKQKFVESLGLPCTFEQAESMSLGHSYNRVSKEFIEAQLGLREMTLDLVKDNYTHFYPIAHNYNLMPIGNASSHEKVIHGFLDELNIDYEICDRKIIKPSELDIVIPEKKLAIEIDGIHWHDNFKINDPAYHSRKTDRAREAGVNLLHFWDIEIDNKLDIAKSIILSKLGLTRNKLYARKCSIVKVQREKEIEFFNENHLSGFAQSKVCYGLEYNDEIVFAMSFSKYRFKKTASYEIVRMASKLNTTVVGGMSRILKHFEKLHNPISILSYADRRISTGNSYKVNGFKEIKTTRPGYFYYKRGHGVISRQSMMKHKLVKLGYDESKTESDIAKEMKLYKLYDCGHILFEKKY